MIDIIALALDENSILTPQAQQIYHTIPTLRPSQTQMRG